MTMIFRQWSGWASPENAAAYPAHFSANVVPELRTVQGFVGADLLKTDDNGELKYTVISRWESMRAIEAFAGDDPSRAVVEPQAVASLVRFESTVTHHESVQTVI